MNFYEQTFQMLKERIVLDNLMAILPKVYPTNRQELMAAQMTPCVAILPFTEDDFLDWIQD